MANYPPANSQYDAWPLVIQFIQISTNYADSPTINSAGKTMPIDVAAREVWERWYNPALWEGQDID